MIEEIKKEFYLIDALHSKAKFRCFADGIMCFQLKDEGTLHEINIINDDAIFFNKMKIVELLKLQNTFYLSHSIYLNGDLFTTKTYHQIDNKN